MQKTELLAGSRGCRDLECLRKRASSTNQGARPTSMSPSQEFPPELARLTLIRVNLSRTLFRQSTGSSAIEGLWGTSVFGRTLCEEAAAVRAGEGAGGPRGAPIPPCDRATVQLQTADIERAKKRGRIGPWGRHRCSLLQSPARQETVSRRYFLTPSAPLPTWGSPVRGRASLG